MQRSRLSKKPSSKLKSHTNSKSKVTKKSVLTTVSKSHTTHSQSTFNHSSIISLSPSTSTSLFSTNTSSHSTIHSQQLQTIPNNQFSTLHSHHLKHNNRLKLKQSKKAHFSTTSTPTLWSTELEQSQPTQPAHTQPLSSQIGQEHYNFHALSSVSSSYRSDPSQSVNNDEFDPSTVPDDADSYDILELLRADQKAELEKNLLGVIDDHQRSYIIYQSAVNFQHRLSKMRSSRAIKQKTTITHCQGALTQMKSLNTQLSLLDVVSLLRGLSIGDPFLKLYTLDHISSLHDFMVFYSCNDQTHLSLVAQALVDYVSTHPNFGKMNIDDDNTNKKKDKNNNEVVANNEDDTTNGLQSVKKSSRRTKLSTANLQDAETQQQSTTIFDPTDPKHSGRKFGEILVFSRNDLPWRVIDLGTVLVHLSFGPERRVNDMESILQSYFMDIHSRNVTKIISNIRLHKCLEITPVSQLEEAKHLMKPDEEKKIIGNKDDDENTPSLQELEKLEKPEEGDETQTK